MVYNSLCDIYSFTQNILLNTYNKQITLPQSTKTNEKLNN